MDKHNIMRWIIKNFEFYRTQAAEHFVKAWTLRLHFREPQLPIADFRSSLEDFDLPISAALDDGQNFHVADYSTARFIVPEAMGRRYLKKIWAELAPTTTLASSLLTSPVLV